MSYRSLPLALLVLLSVKLAISSYGIVKPTALAQIDAPAVNVLDPGVGLTFGLGYGFLRDV